MDFVSKVLKSCIMRQKLIIINKEDKNFIVNERFVIVNSVKHSHVKRKDTINKKIIKE